MATKLPKETKTQKVDPHISGVAGTAFAIVLVAAVVGALAMDGKAADGFIGTYVLGLTLIGAYILYALRVASQWEKAIILRLGRFHKLAGPGCFGLFQS
jgi:regulator of protease activity HflC (stomatin/prohibitin superfamily)